MSSHASKTHTPVHLHAEYVDTLGFIFWRCKTVQSNWRFGY